MEQTPKRKKSGSFDLGKPRQESAKQNKSFDTNQNFKALDGAKETEPRPKAKKKYGKGKPNPNDSITNGLNNNLSVEATSTPFSKHSTVKSIIKNTPQDNEVDVPVRITKPGKRNKSVSFMLDDEEVVTKKTKSQSISEPLVKNNKAKAKFPKNKNKSNEAEKENKFKTSEQETKVKENRKRNKKNKEKRHENVVNLSPEHLNQSKEKGQESLKTSMSTEQQDLSESGDKPSEAKKPKHKKNKKNNSGIAFEPKLSTQSKELKPEVVAENLENLNIGENPHTLTNLLDEMSVATKKKKTKKNKNKNKSEKKAPLNTEDSTEKTVFKKKKSAKDRRRIMLIYDLKTAMIVENIPVELILTYKTLFHKHFNEFGPLKYIGIAEMHSENPKMKFSTIVYFQTEDAAEKALAAGSAAVGGAVLRLRAPPPRERATLVVRSYAALDEQSLSSALLPAGRVRAIHAVAKGKKASGTAFVEFATAEALERALAMAEGLRLGGKKVHLSRFDCSKRPKKRPLPAAPPAGGEEKPDSSSDESD